MKDSKQEITSNAEASKGVELNIKADQRPTDYEYALLSQHVYGVEAAGKGAIKSANKILANWKVKNIYIGAANYLGALYINTKTHQAVLAHRGTDSLQALWEDFQGIYRHGLSTQKAFAFTILEDIIDYCKEEDYALSFTGHSLGAYLAELCVFYCHRSLNYPAVHAVTFESPGSQDGLEVIQANHAQGQIPLNSLDIIAYLSYPNLVNTFNRHVSTAYALEPNTGENGWVPGWHLKQVHTMDNIVTWFEQDASKTAKAACVIDWPLKTERDYFFEHARFENGLYQLPQDLTAASKRGNIRFELDYKGHYTVATDIHPAISLPLIHFAAPLQRWLKAFYKALWQYQRSKSIQSKKLAEHIRNYAKTHQIESPIVDCLLACALIKQPNKQYVFNVISTDKTVHTIRQKLSAWLEEHSDQADLLYGFLANRTTGEIKAVLLDCGAELAETGQIINPEVIGTLTSYPEGTSPEAIERLEAFHKSILTHVADSGVTITAALAAPGAIIKGRIENPRVIGHQSSITSRLAAFSLFANKTASVVGAEVIGQPNVSQKDKTMVMPTTSADELDVIQIKKKVSPS